MRRSKTEGINLSQESVSCKFLRNTVYPTVEKFKEYEAQAKTRLDTIGSYNSSQLQADLNANDAQAQQRIETNLSEIEALESSLNSISSCVQKDMIGRQEYASKIYSLQDKLTTLRKEGNDAEHTAKEAKERARLLEKPYSNTSRWELLFPLMRPMKTESVPVLLSLSILFLTLSLGMFLRLASIEFKFDTTLNSASFSDGFRFPFLKYQ